MSGRFKLSEPAPDEGAALGSAGADWPAAGFSPPPTVVSWNPSTGCASSPSAPATTTKGTSLIATTPPIRYLVRMVWLYSKMIVFPLRPITFSRIPLWTCSPEAILPQRNRGSGGGAWSPELRRAAPRGGSPCVCRSAVGDQNFTRAPPITASKLSVPRFLVAPPAVPAHAPAAVAAPVHLISGSKCRQPKYSSVAAASRFWVTPRPHTFMLVSVTPFTLTAPGMAAALKLRPLPMPAPQSLLREYSAYRAVLPNPNQFLVMPAWISHCMASLCPKTCPQYVVVWVRGAVGSS